MLVLCLSEMLEQGAEHGAMAGFDGGKLETVDILVRTAQEAVGDPAEGFGERIHRVDHELAELADGGRRPQGEGYEVRYGDRHQQDHRHLRDLSGFEVAELHGALSKPSAYGGGGNLLGCELDEHLLWSGS